MFDKFCRSYDSWHRIFTYFSLFSQLHPHCDNDLNKHSVSIAEAIHVPYRPQQISMRQGITPEIIYERIQK